LSNNVIFWIEDISFSVLWKILKINNKQQNIEIRFLRKTAFGWMFLFWLNFIGLVKKDRVREVEYPVEGMWSENGSILAYENFQLSAQIAIAINRELKDLPMYKKITSYFPSNKVSLYIEKSIYLEIIPLVGLLTLIKWYRRCEKIPQRHIIIWHKKDYYSLLQKTWPDKTVDLIFYVPCYPFLNIRKFIKKLYELFIYFIGYALFKDFEDTSSSKSLIAVHYSEGLDLMKRSDLYWYSDDQIDPRRVCVFFDVYSPPPFARKLTKQIENLGMKWLVLDWVKGMPYNYLKLLWKPHREDFVKLNNICNNKNQFKPLEKWFNNMCVELILQVNFWKMFYQKFNIKIHYEMTETCIGIVAQNIALDIIGGVRFGNQRSETILCNGEGLGFHPDHIFFSWNRRGTVYQSGNRNRSNYCIISGFPYSQALRNKKEKACVLEKTLTDRGVKFIVAIFDNTFFLDVKSSFNTEYSKNMMFTFYKEFLEWIIGDVEIGLVIKSKKHKVFASLPEIHRMLDKVNKTGRCIKLDDIVGRLPSDAAYIADISVGIGISSALTEAVIVSGGKGIHCDLTRLRSHPYYEWGYGKVIFDDINKMMVSLKRYKENPANEPELGDWSLHFDELDPFCDGRGGERIGTYIYWLLESFDNGKNRDEAMQYANKLYAEKWGSDKIIPMSELA